MISKVIYNAAIKTATISIVLLKISDWAARCLFSSAAATTTINNHLPKLNCWNAMSERAH